MKGRWKYLFILCLAQISISLGQFKIVPIMGEVANATGAGPVQLGWLISIFSLAGIILAIPGGKILTKIGSKNLLLVLMTALSLGNVIGALSSNYYLLLASRVIEGISSALILTTGLVMISGWFKGVGGTAVAIGIFTSSPPVAMFSVMFAVPGIVKALGSNIKSVWWVIAGTAALSFILVKFILPPASPEEFAEPSGEKPLFRDTVKNRKVWLMAISHACIGFILLGYNYCYPAIFQNVYGLSTEMANRYASFGGIFGLFTGIFAGVLIEKVNKPYAITLAGRIGIIITVALTLSLGTSSPAYIFHQLAVTLFGGGLCLTSNLFIGPMLAKSPTHIGYTMSLINMMMNVGGVASSPVILGLAAGPGWGMAVFVVVLVAVLSFVMAGLLLIPQKKQSQV
jgi:predicted MFS family arabinose efflux permease